LMVWVLVWSGGKVKFCLKGVLNVSSGAWHLFRRSDFEGPAYRSL
jgi:hypothetical protein